jgi:hypothetical protein
MKDFFPRLLSVSLDHGPNVSPAIIAALSVVVLHIADVLQDYFSAHHKAHQGLLLLLLRGNQSISANIFPDVHRLDARSTAQCT